MQLAATLDGIGRPAWIALMIVSFILWWPVGLAILGFLYWSGRMGCGHRSMDCQQRREGWRRAREEWHAMRQQRYGGSTGNRAFDEYRAETLRRLDEEQKAFKEFLNRLRHARDKAEFDQFLAERNSNPDTGSTI
jgi:hypothetical protein